MPPRRPVPGSELAVVPRAPTDLLVLAALCERPLPAAWLSRWAMEDEEVEAALRCGDLVEVAEGLTIVDPARRERLVERAGWAQRQRLHRQLAEAAMRPPARYETAARHFEAIGESAPAARAYLAAAEGHCRRHRHAAAQRCFFAALRQLPHDYPDGDVRTALQSLGRCAALGKEPEEAARDLRHWASQPPWDQRPAVRAEANQQLAALFERAGRPVESALARRAAARDLAATGAEEEAARANLGAASGLMYAAQFRLAREAVEAGLHAAERLRNPDVQAEALIWRGMIRGMLGETAGGQADLEAAIDLSVAHQLTSKAAWAQRLLGTVQEYASEYLVEQEAFARALSYCRRQGETHQAGICLGCLSYSLLRSGDWKRSEQTARRICANRKIPAGSRYVAESVLGLLHAHRGQNRPALRMLQQSLHHCRGAGVLLMDFFNLAGLALVAESMGQVEQAARYYVELLEFWRASDDQHDAIPGLTWATIFFAEQERRDDAAAAAEALDRIATLSANPEASGAACVAAGELLLLEREPGRAAVRFRRAVEQFERRQLSIEPIVARIRWGRALVLVGSVGEGEVVLGEARQRARRLGARPWLARADAVRVPERPPGVAALPVDTGAAGWDLLSPRQRDVARSLARGLTNKEIAQQLGLSVRTIDMHVAHVLERLNCRSRSEAAAQVTGALR